jgi:Dolichyl-phosphate-mannose-protein mannosyltransferase
VTARFSQSRRTRGHRHQAVSNRTPQASVSFRDRIFSGPAIVLYIAAAKLVFHLLTAGRYGIFRDELYYLACSEHLDWGYVDQPPLIALVVWIARHAFGDSLLGLRLLPAIAGAGLVLLTGKLSQDMGGRRFAQALAALAVAVVPVYLIMHHWMTMNAFEPLLWMGCAWCVVRAINSGRAHYWIGFGVLLGVGMENKYSIAFFAIGACVGLLLTRERHALKSRSFWIGMIGAFLIFLPNLFWLVQHKFPFLELMATIRLSGRDVVRGPLSFIVDQAKILNPVLLPLWAGGLIWLFFGRLGRRYRVLGWSYCVMLVMFVVLHGKNYYLAPAYPMLLAAGAVAFETVAQERWRWSRAVYVVLIVVVSVGLAPLWAPILSPQAYVEFQKKVGLEPLRAENQRTGLLPQYFADEFGWEEMTREVARIYNALPAEERARTAIFANSYGQAGAIDFFGPKYGLPKAVSNHQSYWLWGPRDYTGETVIVLGSDGRGDREHFETVDVAGRAQHPYSRLDERFDIFLCRRLKPDLRILWPQIKNWS